MNPVKFGLSDKTIRDARLFLRKGTMANPTSMQQPIHGTGGLVIGGIERYFNLTLKCPNGGFRRRVWAAVNEGDDRNVNDGGDALSHRMPPAAISLFSP
eukprot:6580109-Prymnesium_polylepis.1